MVLSFQMLAIILLLWPPLHPLDYWPKPMSCLLKSAIQNKNIATFAQGVTGPEGLSSKVCVDYQKDY